MAMVNLIEGIGLLAGFLTTLSFLPQVIKVWKTRSVADLSLSMYLVLSAGVGLWLVYGLYIKSLPVILANGITLLLTLLILVMKLRWRNQG